MRGRIRRSGAAAALVAMLAGGPSAAAAIGRGPATGASRPQATASAVPTGGVHRTHAGNALARSVLLTRRQLGRRWRAGAAPRRVAPITCPSFDPLVRKATEVGAAATGRFSRSLSGPFVSQSVYAYATAAEGEHVARAQLRRRLVVCVADSLSGGSTHSVKFTVLRKHGLRIPSFGASARGYRVAGIASQTGQKVQVYLDALVLARGRLVTELSLASFYAPPPRHLERRLQRLATRRLALGAG